MTSEPANHFPGMIIEGVTPRVGGDSPPGPRRPAIVLLHAGKESHTAAQYPAELRDLRVGQYRLPSYQYLKAFLADTGLEHAEDAILTEQPNPGLQQTVTQWVASLPRGIVGLVEIIGVTPPDLAPGHPTTIGGLPGTYQYLLGSVFRLPLPVSQPGQLGLWTLQDDDVVAQVLSQPGVRAWLAERGVTAPETTAMKVLSVRQPWSHEILEGRKKIENRSHPVIPDMHRSPGRGHIAPRIILRRFDEHTPDAKMTEANPDEVPKTPDKKRKHKPADDGESQGTPKKSMHD